jgi:hypothetical protein
VDDPHVVQVLGDGSERGARMDLHLGVGNEPGVGRSRWIDVLVSLLAKTKRFEVAKGNAAAPREGSA